MAHGYRPGSGGSKEEWAKVRRCRRFQELFHGRFTPHHAGIILKEAGWDLNKAVGFTLSSEPGDLRDLLKEVDGGEWNEVGMARRIRREQILTNKTVRLLAEENTISHEIRQFACEACDNMWWRKVPIRKLVSRCDMCKKSFDAIPRSLEWGRAKFKCECGNEFHGFGAMKKTKSPCFKCHQMCDPSEILPPLKRDRREGRRPRGPGHSCTAPNCFKRCPPGPTDGHVVTLCVHPKSLPKKVIEASRPHRSTGRSSDDSNMSYVSTGSTVKTFLSQDDLESPFDLYEPSLADVDEYLGN